MRLRSLLGAAGLSAVILVPSLAASAAPASPPAAPATTAPSPPQTPTVAPGHGQVTVSWTAPSSTGGSPITAYRVRVVPDGRTVTVAAPATSATVMGLADGTQVTATVVAINHVGAGAAAAAGTAIPTPPITGGFLLSEVEAQLRDLAVAPDQTLYVATGDAILKRAFGGKTFTPLDLGDISPSAIAVGSDGELFWTDTQPGHIVIREFVDGKVSTVAGATSDAPAPWPTTEPTPALGTPIPGALDLAVNHQNGTVFILDYVRRTIYRFTVGGDLAVVAGVPTTSVPSSSDGDGGPATAAHLNGPQGLAISEFGTVYVSETWSNRVRAFTDGGTIDTVAGDGTNVIDPAADLDADTTGVPTPSQMVWLPTRGLLIDSAGRKRLLVDDRLLRIGDDAFDRALFDSPAPPGNGPIGANDNTLSLAWDGATLWGTYVVPGEEGWHRELRAAGPWLPASEPAEHPGFGSWADLVTLHHRAIVDRAPTTSERSAWVAALEAGTKTPGQLDDALRRSTENTTNVDPVVRLYRAFLGRAPDASGLRFWIARKRNVAPARTWSIGQMAASFAGSTEFHRTYGSLSNRAFVTRIYTDVLGRPADQAGVDFWTKRLDTGRQSRAQVMVGFSESTEYRRKQAANTDVAVAYLTLVGRMPTAAETTAWTTAAAGGATNAELLDDLVEAAPKLV
ncbi:MAG: hypothetical protein JWO77_3663 [Ilumatobacteraceae bacterium]|nr:hypothetical protein [Ilumatobacteraceae bacterium]